MVHAEEVMKSKQPKSSRLEIILSKNENSTSNGSQERRNFKIHISNNLASNVNKGDNKVEGIADIVGEYGIYQLSLTIITFLRYVGVAMMTNTGSLLAPSLDYWCVLPGDIGSSVLVPENETLNDYLHNKCQVDLINKTQPYRCEKWTFSEDLGVTLTDTFGLVCERDWLRSAFQSTVSVGVVVASVAWGSFSDRHGRNFTIRVCFVFSLVMGLVSYLANDFLLYAAARALCSFGDLGLVVSLSTIIVELLGNKYRGAVCIVVYTGWAIGVMVMPWLTEYYKNYRHLMLFTVLFHALTGLWLMTIHESPRWLLINGKIDKAKLELKRVVRLQGKFIALIPFQRSIETSIRLKEVDEKFEQIKPKYILIAERNRVLRLKEESGASKVKLCCLSFLGGLNKIGQLFKSFELVKTTMTLIWATFNCELLYMLFIMINSDIGDLKLNYLIGGLMETVATIVSISMIAALRRKLSLTFTLSTISCLCLTLAFTHQLPSVSLWILNVTKLAISTLSSLVYVTTTEIFPTSVRQTGFGLSGTIGSLGAVVAPFIRAELTAMIGMTYVMIILFLLTMSSALTIPFLLRETKGVEIPDDVEDIESATSDELQI